MYMPVGNEEGAHLSNKAQSVSKINKRYESVEIKAPEIRKNMN